MLSQTCKWDAQTGKRSMISNPTSVAFNPVYRQTIANADKLCGAPAVWLVGTKRYGLAIEMCEACSRFMAFRSTRKLAINNNQYSTEITSRLIELLKVHRRFMRRRSQLSEAEVNAMCMCERQIFCFRADQIAWAEHLLDMQEDALINLLAHPKLQSVFAS